MRLRAILLALNAARDRNTRNSGLIAVSLPFIAFLLIFTLIVYLLASPLYLLGASFSGDEYAALSKFKAENDSVIAGYVDLSFCGSYPLPFKHDGNITVTDSFGYRIHPVSGEYKLHTGIDFGLTHHCEILSIADGVVTFAGVNGGYGNCVIIRHEDLSGTFYSLYAHLSKVNVFYGQTVVQGEVIGLEGGAESDPNHGVSTGHHLHFEIRDSSHKSVDPAAYLSVQIFPEQTTSP